ncbi:Arginine--tRNA ligase [Streptomyces sp. RB5]|uniref:arginine--tRNA ligase n=1 Tax=Streptomyces smaragdinus TaxID=2585196 RepID=A0A7K0CF30_9ACTN|nr:DALR anticodon-binding domain-containing protein [Streptomyces smaragdinus]MQY11996.1 Arginine--tRNA ligase [Streptomyces smaragdinus]
MTPERLSDTVLRTVREAVADGVLDAPVPERIALERPRPGGRGDWTTAVALQLAGAAGRPPADLAADLARRLETDPAIAEATVTGPGFLNLTLTPAARPDPVRDALTARTAYGHTTALRGERYRVPQPAEPRAARWTAALDRVLRAAGAAPDPAGDPVTVHVVPLPAHDPAAWGEDALAWASLRPAAQDHPVLDPGLLVQRESNPLFLVRYAHARARALERQAKALGVTYRDTGMPAPAGVPYRSSREGQKPLTARIGELPAVVESAARHRAPDRVARYAETLADELLAYLTRTPCLPQGDETATGVHHTRLRTADAAGVALASALTLLGVTAPEHL